jgi:DNA-binding protein HU-beta
MARPAKKAPAKSATKAAPKAAPKAAATGGALTLPQIAEQLAAQHELPKSRTQALLVDMISIVAKNLKKGEKVRIGGLGIFEVKKRAARKGRNPATGEAIKIKASKRVAFKALKELKEAI